ncbi:S8 family serine peptidase [Solirubrobacter ginsenosidimutans]|uniref:S8 family serine peptidase n=1 Tax=Solirubrobacter ginsenosidimutans TaxID=490573 RepID=A0A9X3MNR8_9ACTN|nr:S8 family serine peptidase [Solirubrobacter ginsenosidimutans]MDA0159011.1 S8 family serine peptidase [Solirubrobacter ginsenosidimutans]
MAQSAHAQLSAPPPAIQSYAGDPGKVGDPASWRTPEFLRDNGMLSIGAEFAYAAGYAGGGMNIGIVDSGSFFGHMREHGSLDTNYTVGDRFFSVVAQGGYTGPTPGYYDPAINDLHGTHVSGTVAASRDGVGETQPTGPVANMHGVAFNADVYIGNTGKTDGVLYGLLPPTATLEQTPDNAYIGNVYRAVNAAATADGKPIRLITTSWGSQPATENYNTYDGLNTAWRHLYTPEGVADPNGKTSHWLNGAIDVARTGTILQFTAGNGGYTQPTPRAAAPYFLPDLEHSWYTTSGINPATGRTFNPDGSVLVPGQQEFNQCGVAKWSCVTAPSRNINSTTVAIVDGVPQPRYGSASGTSMAGPHSAAELALIMSRFPYLTNEQAMHTLFTSGRQNNTISNATGAAISNPTRGQIVQVPDSRNGWGTPNLREAFKGPGQLLGPVDLDTHGYSDVWSNNISDVAITARRQEDAAEAATWQATKVTKGWTNGLPADASDIDKSDYAIGTRREQARATRVYTGSLSKRGEGTLFLTGTETWHGETTVNAGKLSVNGSHASAIDVAGGTLGGSGSVAGGIDVASGVLAPGLAPAEAARITDVPVQAGNVLSTAGNVRIGAAGRLVVTVRSGTDYGKLRADGDIALDGPLVLDIQGAVSPGSTLTLASGRSVTGTFDDLPEGSFLKAGNAWFWVSYMNNSVTLIAVATADGTVGGTVPATLALTLGAPATFGAFTPGVAREYTAATTANVISTAANATLTVADPDTVATGRLVNGTFALVQPLQASGGGAFAAVGGSAAPTTLKAWPGPVSNDAVAVTFKQTIGANEPLRTGSYSKTLTYTLSTTAP